MQSIIGRAHQEKIPLAGMAWISPEMPGMPSPDMLGWLSIVRLAPKLDRFTERVAEYGKNFDMNLTADSVDTSYLAICMRACTHTNACMYRYAPALFDAILLYAHAATRVLSEGGDLADGKAVTAAVRNTSFVGRENSVVALDKQGDRIESYMVLNYILAPDGVMRSVRVGLYNSTLHQYRSEGTIVWPGNTTAVPVALVKGTVDARLLFVCGSILLGLCRHENRAWSLVGCHWRLDWRSCNRWCGYPCYRASQCRSQVTPG